MMYCIGVLGRSAEYHWFRHDLLPNRLYGTVLRDRNTCCIVFVFSHMLCCKILDPFLKSQCYGTIPYFSTKTLLLQ